MEKILEVIDQMTISEIRKKELKKKVQEIQVGLVVMELTKVYDSIPASCDNEKLIEIKKILFTSLAKIKLL